MTARGRGMAGYWLIAAAWIVGLLGGLASAFAFSGSAAGASAVGTTVAAGMLTYAAVKLMLGRE